MKRSVLLLAGALVSLSACDGFREAMTAHVDVAASAGSQELSVTRLGDLLGNAPVPLDKEVAKAVAQVWVNYQLLGHAAAQGDSLSDTTLINEAMWSQLAQLRANRFLQEVGKDWVKEPGAPSEAAYNQGDVLAARHILLRFPGEAGGPPQQPTDAQRDSVKRIADEVRSQVTAANFAQLAQRYSGDPGSAARGGDLGAFPRGQTVAEFERGVLSLQPGQISQPVMSPFGYHIIYRTPFTELAPETLQMIGQMSSQRQAAVAESTYFDRLMTNSKVVVRPNVAKKVKEVAGDPDAFRRDRAVLATHTKGEFTAGRFAQWLLATPPQNNLRQQIAQAPDTALPQLVRDFVRFDLVVAQADSAKIAVDSTETQELRRAFVNAVTSAWAGLGVSPEGLRDSTTQGAASEETKERIAAERVDAYFARLLSNTAPFVQVPSPVEQALRDKYPYKVNDAGIDRALDLAARVRARADSARAAQQPPTAVPIPGQAPAGAPPAGPPATPPAGDTSRPPAGR